MNITKKILSGALLCSLLIFNACEADDSEKKEEPKSKVVNNFLLNGSSEVFSDLNTSNSSNSVKYKSLVTKTDSIVDTETINISKNGLTISGDLTFTMEFNDDQTAFIFEYSGDLTYTYTNFTDGEYTYNGAITQNFKCTMELEVDEDEAEEFEAEITIVTDGTVTITGGDYPGVLIFDNLTCTIDIDEDDESVEFVSGSVTYDGEVVELD